MWSAAALLPLFARFIAMCQSALDDLCDRPAVYL